VVREYLATVFKRQWVERHFLASAGRHHVGWRQKKNPVQKTGSSDWGPTLAMAPKVNKTPNTIELNYTLSGDATRTGRWGGGIFRYEWRGAFTYSAGARGPAGIHRYNGQVDSLM